MNTFSTVIKQKKWIEGAHDDFLTELVRQGKSDDNIARIMGFSQSTILAYREKLGLPRNIKRPVLTIDRGGKTPEDKPSPLAVAAHWLGPRLVERPAGYFLDGRPVSLNQLMQETNRLLEENGLPQRLENPQWRV